MSWISMLDYKLLRHLDRNNMKKAIEALRRKIFSSGKEDRTEFRKRAYPHRGLHRGQIKAMLRWNQTPVVAYK